MAIRNYEKDTFEIMLYNWKIDNEDGTGKYENSIISDVAYSDDIGWSASISFPDDKNEYMLSDDGEGNIRLDYLGTR